MIKKSQIQWVVGLVILTILIFPNLQSLALAETDKKTDIETNPIVKNSNPIIKQVFDNGLVLLIKPNPANEVVSVNAFIRMGAIYEPGNQRGLSKLMQNVLIKGTTTRSAKDIVFETESVGASIDAGLVDSGYGHLSLRTTLIGLDCSLPVFLDILQNPVFPIIEFEKEKQIMLQQLATAYDQPALEAYLNFRTLFYGDYPIGIRQEEIAKMVAKLTRDDLVAWYQKTYIPNNMVISIVGNINPRVIEKTFQDSLGKWLKGKELPSTSSAMPSFEDDRQIVKTRNSEASFLVLGYPAPVLSGDDNPTMSVINYILGGDMGSRLFVELRDKNGLAYDVSTEYYASNYPSNIFAFMATAPENYQAAKTGIIAEFKRLTTQLVPAEELQAAKQALKGRFLMSHETNASQSDHLGGYELLGVGYQYDQTYPQLIDKVTAADIQRVAQKYFAHYSLSVLTPVKVD
jgi:predicted Zn-dependent peptidase